MGCIIKMLGIIYHVFQIVRSRTVRLVTCMERFLSVNFVKEGTVSSKGSASVSKAKGSASVSKAKGSASVSKAKDSVS